MHRITLALMLFAATTLCADQNWPQFRGPKGDGTTDSKGLPLKWSETENVRWKVAIHGKAWSSPVIWGNQIWMTTATEDGKQLSVVVVDKESGKVLLDKKFYDVAEPQFCHKFNSYASPTPVIEDGRVYVTWGSPATACIDTRTFKVLWARRDIECNHFRAAGSSPVLFGNLLINNYDGSDFQFVIALDKRTGETVWKTDRSVDYMDLDASGKPEAGGDWRKAFSTPHIANIRNHPVLLSSGAKAHYAYNPANGEELWRMDWHKQHSASSRPAFGHGYAYFPTGWGKGELIVLRTDRTGVLGEKDVIWHKTRSIPKKPSVQIVGDLLFTVDDSGIGTCYDAKSGEVHWQERIGGNFSASPLAAEGRLYFSNETGDTTVVAADKQFKVLAKSKLEEGFMASPAVSGKALFLRTKTHLYRIEK